MESGRFKMIGLFIFQNIPGTKSQLLKGIVFLNKDKYFIYRLYPTSFYFIHASLPQFSNEIIMAEKLFEIQYRS